MGSNSTKVSGSPWFISDNTKISSSAGLKLNTDDYIEGTGSLPYGPLNKDMNIRSVAFSFSGSAGGQFIQLCTDNTFETGSEKHNWRIGLKSDNKLYFDTVIQSGSQATASLVLHYLPVIPSIKDTIIVYVRYQVVSNKYGWMERKLLLKM